MADLVTVQVVAAELGRPASTIKYWCRQHEIGQLVTPHLRLLTREDVEALRSIAATIRRGNPGPRDEAGKFSPALSRKRTRSNH
jgi:hypothetical protein